MMFFNEKIIDEINIYETTKKGMLEAMNIHIFFIYSISSIIIKTLLNINFMNKKLIKLLL